MIHTNVGSWLRNSLSETQLSPTQLELEGRLVSNASIMNKFFIEKVIKIRDFIDNAPFSFANCYRMMSGKRCNLSLQCLHPNNL